MKTTLLSTMFALATAGLLGQTTIFVKPNATGDGTSWSNATDLETAVTSATSGTQVWVQAATYHPKTMLTVADGVALYGGFDGTELSLLQRDLSDKTTVIDAQKKYGSVIRLGASATLNGFTIQNGNAQHNPHRNGGGVWADDNSIVENCIIIDNAAMINGGGLYSKGPTQIINTTIQNNTAKGNGDNMYGHCKTVISDVTLGTGSEVVVLNDTITLRDTVLVYNEIQIPDTVTLTVTDTLVINDTVIISDPSGTLTATSSIEIVTHPSGTAQSKALNTAFSALTVSATSDEELSYQWYTTTSNNNASGTAIAGATGTSYTPPTATNSAENYYFYYYCVVSNTSGSVTSNVSGVHRATDKSCNLDVPKWGNNLGTVGFVSSTEWTIGSQIWSDAVMATNCNKTTYDGGASGDYNADCQHISEILGDVFSWCAQHRYKDLLCPEPWRIPTSADFNTLQVALGGNSLAINGNQLNLTVYNRYIDTWGGRVSSDGGVISYWSSTEHNATNGLCLFHHIYNNNGALYTQLSVGKEQYISLLRCVR